MTKSARKDLRGPKNKDGLVSQSTSEDGATTGMAHKEAGLAQPVELDIADSHFMADAYDTYADLRAKGPVSRLRFAGGEEESGDGEESREFFFRHETFFVTHYNEAIATLLDDRFSADPRSGMSEEQLGAAAPDAGGVASALPEHPLTRPAQPHAAAQTSPAKLHRTGHASVAGEHSADRGRLP